MPRDAAISVLDNPSSTATATSRSASLSELGNVGGGSGKLNTASSSPSILTLDARRPMGTDASRGLLKRPGRGTETILARRLTATERHAPFSKQMTMDRTLTPHYGSGPSRGASHIAVSAKLRRMTWRGSNLHAAREPTSLPSPLRALPPGQPAHLYMRTLDQSGHLVLVSFSLGRLLALTRAELEVVRWAHAGHSNGVIARERQTASHTVARQMSEAMRKLGVGARLRLAKIPELSAWSPPGLGIRAGGVPAHTLLSGDGREVGLHEVGRTWREIAAGQWIALAGVDAGGLRHAVMRRDSAKAVDWLALNTVQRKALALTASGCPQKVIAMKLGLAPSTVSGALQIAHRRLGFGSLSQLLRAYCASRDIIDFEECEASVAKE